MVVFANLCLPVAACFRIDKLRVCVFESVFTVYTICLYFCSPKDRIYVAEKIYKDMEMTSKKLSDCKTFLVDQISTIEHLKPESINAGMAETCMTRAESALQSFDDMKLKLKTVGV